MTNKSVQELEEILKSWYKAIIMGEDTSEIEETVVSLEHDFLFSIHRSYYFLICYVDALTNFEDVSEIEKLLMESQKMFPFNDEQRQIYNVYKSISYYQENKIHDALQYALKAKEYGMFENCYSLVCLQLAIIYERLDRYIDAFAYALKARNQLILEKNMHKIKEVDYLIAKMDDKIGLSEDKFKNHLLLKASKKKDKLLT